MRRSTQPELMDESGLDPVELAANLRDIRRVNRLLGGTAIVLRHLPALLAHVPSERPARVLDLGTGSGDIPLAVARWGQRRGVRLDIVASDYADEMLAIARRHLAGSGIHLAKHDARRVDLPDGSVDIVLCSLTLHHFDPEDAVRVLAEMDRLAAAGLIVNDLCRGRLGFAAAWIAARLTTRNRLTRNDAPLSVRRAYTPAELRELLERAGVARARISRHPWFRMAAVVVKHRGVDG